jgi:hypothetical protein
MMMHKNKRTNKSKRGFSRAVTCFKEELKIVGRVFASY